MWYGGDTALSLSVLRAPVFAQATMHKDGGLRPLRPSESKLIILMGYHWLRGDWLSWKNKGTFKTVPKNYQT